MRIFAKTCRTNSTYHTETNDMREDPILQTKVSQNLTTTKETIHHDMNSFQAKQPWYDRKTKIIEIDRNRHFSKRMHQKSNLNAI